jgi:hypothetical protein
MRELLAGGSVHPRLRFAVVAPPQSQTVLEVLDEELTHRLEDRPFVG